MNWSIIANNIIVQTGTSMSDGGMSLLPDRIRGSACDSSHAGFGPVFLQQPRGSLPRVASSPAAYLSLNDGLASKRAGLLVQNEPVFPQELKDD